MYAPLFDMILCASACNSIKTQTVWTMIKHLYVIEYMDLFFRYK